MFKRTFKVIFRPIKNNFLLLPDNYYNVVSTYDTGCLSLQYNGHTHYASWAPHAGSVNDTEIGINARVAKEIGLKENDLIKCSLIADVLTLKSVFVTPVSPKDWEIIELSSERITGSVLEQTRIVNSSQILIVWINKSMQVALTVDRVRPNGSYGRLDHNTELVIAPNLYKGITNDTAIRHVTKSSVKNGNAHDSHTTLNIADDMTRLLRSRTTNQMKSLTNSRSASLAVIQYNSALRRSVTENNVERLASVAKVKRQDDMDHLKKDLRRENTNVFEFRVISCEWHPRTQISDVYVTKSSWPKYMDIDCVYCMCTPSNNEYYVRVRASDEDENSRATIHRSIEVNVNLMKLLQLKELEKVTIKQKAVVVNFVEKIELFAHKKTHYKILENAFKRYVIERTSFAPMLLNQNEVMRLEQEDELIISIGILPEHFRYCVIDGQFLKECKIYAADIVRSVDEFLKVNAEVETPLSVKDLIKLREFDAIVDQVVNEIKLNLCLDPKNSVLRQGNVLVVGAAGTGKTVLVERVLDQLIRKPSYCFFEIFQCSRSKGRKIESIQKDLRSIFTKCLVNGPSIVVLENLDVLAHSSGDQPTQDGEYFNRIADMVHQLIVQYTSNNSIAVIATANDMQSLNRRLYSPRGRHVFQVVTRLPNLDLMGRSIIIEELCSHINSDKLDYTRFAMLTEGYNQGDVVQFVERAIFYAYRLSKTNPVMTNEHLVRSLENTNSYCLQGIESNQKMSIPKGSKEIDELKLDEIPALQSVVAVFEEVLMWPSMYPNIFNASPLRNQAGVLLYGPPGTGKTFLVMKMAASWNLRTISVKGPELLAKYIGQSEENVRNLFNRARSAKPCVLFFDEFDSLAPKRGHDSTGVTDRVVNQLLTELDGVEGLQGVTVIAATSRPELLDPALLRSGRIDRLVECPLPNAAARVRIFEVLSASLNLDDSVDFEFFASRTQNYTGADIHSILTTANMQAVKESLDEFGHEKLPERIIVKQKHLIESLNTTRPSLTSSDVAKYYKTYERFTNKDKGAYSRDYVAKRATLA